MEVLVLAEEVVVDGSLETIARLLHPIRRIHRVAALLAGRLDSGLEQLLEG